MTAPITSFVTYIWGTLVNPAAMAQLIMQRSYDRGTLWMGVILVSILSVILVLVAGMGSPIVLPMGFTPMLYGWVMGCVLIVLTMAIYLTGQVLGGTSTFPHAFAMVIWLEMTALCLRALQVILSVLSPNIAVIVSLLGMMALLRVFVHFVNEIHQFNSLPRAVGTIVLAVVGVAFGMAIFLTLIGISV